MSIVTRRRTKVFVGPCWKYFSMLRSEIICDCVYRFEPGEAPGADQGVRPTPC
jgi:hypothetical protein